MKLVKARYKNVELLERKYLCCPEFVAANISPEIFTLDLENVDHMNGACAYCHADHGYLHGVMNVTLGHYDVIDVYDIDEGEATSAQAN